MPDPYDPDAPTYAWKGLTIEHRPLSPYGIQAAELLSKALPRVSAPLTQIAAAAVLAFLDFTDAVRNLDNY